MNPLNASLLGEIKALTERLRYTRELASELHNGGSEQAHEWLHSLTVRAEERVGQRNARVQAATDELTAFASCLSHDLRAPLRTLQGMARALAEDCAGRVDAEGEDRIRRMLVVALNMERLVDDLLILFRLSRVDMVLQAMDLSALAGSVAERLASSEPGRKVAFEIAPQVFALGDETLLGTLLENLLGNAWKYTAKHDSARIEFGVLDLGLERAFFVRDDGAGFDPAHAGKLFAPFQRLHSGADFPGTGVGLALVRRIVERHGGRTWAEGAVERGATFYFTLGGPEGRRSRRRRRGQGTRAAAPVR